MMQCSGIFVLPSNLNFLFAFKEIKISSRCCVAIVQTCSVLALKTNAKRDLPIAKLVVQILLVACNVAFQRLIRQWLLAVVGMCKH